MKMKWLCLLVVVMFGVMLVAGCSKEEAPPVKQTSAPSVAKPVIQEEQADESRADNGAVTFESAPQQSTVFEGGAPKITMIKLNPVPAFPGSILTAVVVSEDPDDDLVSYSYQWLRNDEPVDGDFEEFDTTGFTKGDLIAVEVTPSDGENNGDTRKSLPVLLHNRPPEITSFPTGMADGRLVYQVEVIDPEGDSLSFSLDGAPAGMEIDSESGLIDWQVPEDLSGKYQIKVLVSDGDAKSYQTFSLTFSQQ
jgi:hypothetical protein